MFSKFLIIAGALLIHSYAHAEDPASCATELDGFSGDRGLQPAATDPDVVTLEVGGLEATLGKDPSASMTGGILLRRGDQLAGADNARYEPDDRSLHLDGNVRYEDPDSQVASDTAEFSYDFGRIRFEGADFSLYAVSYTHLRAHET